MVPFTIRRAVRENQELGQRAASTNRALAIHFLTTTTVNVFCLYHFNNDKRGGKYDGQEDEKYKIVGIPLARNANEVKKDRKQRPEGFFHCGCSEDVALMDFYIWKHWVAKSGVYEEGMRDKIMDPRTRYFVITVGMNRCARICINDLYCDGNTPRETDKARIYRQIKRLKKVLKKMEEEEAAYEENGEEEAQEGAQTEYVHFLTCFLLHYEIAYENMKGEYITSRKQDETQEYC